MFTLFRIEGTQGLIFLLPTIVLDFHKEKWHYNEISIVWFNKQLTWKW